MDSQDQQKFSKVEEEILEEKLSNCSQQFNDSLLQNQQQFDQLLPRPAFQIENDNQNLTLEEKEAFNYIMSVRIQKQALLNNKKHEPAQQYYQSISSFTQQQQNIADQTQSVFLDQIRSWITQTTSHWSCVVQNIKYLINNSPSSSFFKQKLNYDCVLQLPLIHSICLNKWLTLSQIQHCLVQFCNTHYAKLQNYGLNQIQTKEDHFNLWINSLLALHQSYASYTNFQALASINAILQKQNYVFSRQRQQIQQTVHSNLTNSIIGWLVNIVLLIDVFKQNNLKKYITSNLITYIKEHSHAK